MAMEALNLIAVLVSSPQEYRYQGYSDICGDYLQVLGSNFPPLVPSEEDTEFRTCLVTTGDHSSAIELSSSHEACPHMAIPESSVNTKPLNQEDYAT